MRPIALCSFLVLLFSSTTFAQQPQSQPDSAGDRDVDPRVAPLVEKLAAAHPDDRRAAAKALGALNHRAATAIPALIPLLDDDQAGVRSDVAQAIGQIARQPDAAVPALIKRFQTEETSFVRRRLAEAIGRFGPNAAAGVSALAAALEDDYRYTREAAVTALGEVGPAAAPALPAMFRLMTTDDYRHARAAALEAVVRVKPPVDVLVPQVVTMLDDEYEFTRARAAAVIGELGPDASAALPALLDRLGDGSAHVRSSIIKAIGALRPTDDAAVNPLVAMLEAEDDTLTQRLILDALHAIGEPAWPGLRDIFGNHQVDPYLRGLALRHLASADDPLPALQPALPALLQATANADALLAADARGVLARIVDRAVEPIAEAATSHEAPRVRRACMRVLRDAGSDVLRQAAPYLIRGFADDDDDVRIAAQLAIRSAGDPTIAWFDAIRDVWDHLEADGQERRLLTLLLRGMADELNAHHVDTLATMLTSARGASGLTLLAIITDRGPDAAPAAARIAGLAVTNDDRLAIAALGALHKMGTHARGAISVLNHMVANRIIAADRRWRAAVLLGRFADGSSYESLAAAAEDGNAEVRNHSLQALAALKNPVSIPLFVKHATSDTSTGVRVTAIRALAFFGTDAAAAVDALKSMAANQDEPLEVRDAAAATLLRIDDDSGDGGDDEDGGDSDDGGD